MLRSLVRGGKSKLGFKEENPEINMWLDSSHANEMISY
jgi:hypothetical protein